MQLFWMVSLILIVSTVAQEYAPPSRLLIYLTLGVENNLASWFSSMSLLLVGINYQDSARYYQAEKLPLRIVALVLVALSIDEQASLHERLFEGNWTFLIVTGVVCVAIFAYAVHKLLASPEWRKSTFLLIAGFAFFSTVVLQEFFEHRVSLPRWAVGPRTAFEEGCELVGIFLCLLSVARIRAPANSLWVSSALLSDRSALGIVPLAILGMVFHTISVLIAPHLGDLSTRGNPAMWFPIAVYFVCAYYCGSRVLHSGELPLVEVLLAIVFLSLSALHIMFNYDQHAPSFLLALGLVATIAVVYLLVTRVNLRLSSFIYFLPALAGLVLYFVNGFLMSALFVSGAIAFAVLLVSDRTVLEMRQ